MKAFAVLLLLLSFSFCAFAQSTNSQLTGTVRSKDGQPLVAATVVMHRLKDSAMVQAAATDRSGRFTLGLLPGGSYFITVTCIGYAGYSINRIDAFTTPIVLPDIVLTPAAKTLGEVSVVGQKPFVEFKLDKMVVNVASSPFFHPGQSGLDVLERSPGVEVDYMNNTIGLNGRMGTSIYINGRVSYLHGQDLLNYLRGLPAGSIETVELMSQPSARYDAASSGGVINIVLRKNLADGFSGSFTLSPILGYYWKTRDNLLLNWRKEKANLNFTIGFTDLKNFNDRHTVSSFRPVFGAPFDQYQDYSSSTISSSRSWTPRLALDYQASKKTSLGLEAGGLFSDNSSIAGGPVTVYDSLHKLFEKNPFTSVGGNTVANIGINGHLLRKLDEKERQLTADADYLYYHSHGTQLSNNYPYDANGNPGLPYLVNGSLPSDVDIYAFKADYSGPVHFPRRHPLPGAQDDTKLEAGFKSSYVRTDNNSYYIAFDTLQKQWRPDTSLNNHFVYTENINAAYINVTRQLSKQWSAELGVRAEQTVSTGNETVQGGKFDKNYVDVFPTVFMGYTPNDKHSFEVSYGRNINRPSYLDLNPFRYVINQYNIREGNPALQPDISNGFQFSYHYKSEFSATLYYFKFDHVFGQVFLVSEQGGEQVTIQTKENVAWRRNIFLSIYYNKALAKWWNASWSATCIDAKLYDPGNTGATTDELRGVRINLNNQFVLAHGWGLNLRSYYSTRWLEGIRIYNLPVWLVSTGVTKKLLTDKGTLGLTVNDPFLLFKPGQTTGAATFYLATTNRPESRTATLTFNYRFGRAKQQQRKSNTSAGEEQQRVNF